MATTQTLVISALAVFAIFIFGATIFTQAVSNGGYTDQYPLTTSVQNFNNSSMQFASKFTNITQSMTSTQTNTNPTDGNPFSQAGAAIGVIWDLITSSIGMASTALVSVSSFLPPSFIGLAVVYLGVIFVFAVFAYILRWFT